MSSMIMLAGIVGLLLTTDMASTARAAASCITVLGAVLELAAVWRLSRALTGKRAKRS